MTNMNEINKNIRAGVVSVTFRQYAYKNFINCIKLTDLACIEWGSDIHVPYNDSEKAVNVNNEMSANSLATASYGSYYRLGQPHEPGLFSMILDTAKIISAPMIRVWGGTKNSGDLTSAEKNDIIADAVDIAAVAKKENLKISLEYHGSTITNTAESAVDFIKEVRNQGGDNVYLYWQANQYVGFNENKLNLMKLCPYLSNIHVFAWEKDTRLPLAEHKNIWIEYINIIKDNADMINMRHDFLLEFVKNDKAEQLVEDSKVITELIGGIW